jgi:hypothetical protein
MGDYYDEGDRHEGCVQEQDAAEYAYEHHQEAILEWAREDLAVEQAKEWLRESQYSIELLSIVSHHDKDQLKDTIRRGISHAQEDALPDQVPESQLFAVATDVSAFLESLAQSSADNPLQRLERDTPQFASEPTPSSRLAVYAKRCTLGQDLDWAREIIAFTRAFRDLLFAVCETRDGANPKPIPREYGRLRAQGNADSQAADIIEPLHRIRDALQSGAAPEPAFWVAKPSGIMFGRIANPARTPIQSFLAEWACEYLDLYPMVDLAVCIECGTIFARDRRDNFYCSRTCQNRVAYKRKKIFEAGALRELNVDPDAPDGLRRGVWVHHPRLGLGVVEGVVHRTRRGLHAARSAVAPPAKMSLREVHEWAERISAETGNKVEIWKLLDPHSIHTRVRFLHGLRTFKFADLFPSGKEDKTPVFYCVEAPQTLIDLL